MKIQLKPYNMCLTLGVLLIVFEDSTIRSSYIKRQFIPKTKSFNSK